MDDNLFGTVSKEATEKRDDESNQTLTNLINIFNLIDKYLKRIFDLKEQIKYISDYRKNYGAGPVIPEKEKGEYIGLREDFKRVLKSMEDRFADFIKESNVNIPGLETLLRLDNNYEFTFGRIKSSDLQATSASIAELEMEEERLLNNICKEADEMVAKAKSVLDDKILGTTIQAK